MEAEAAKREELNRLRAELERASAGLLAKAQATARADEAPERAGEALENLPGAAESPQARIAALIEELCKVVDDEGAPAPAREVARAELEAWRSTLIGWLQLERLRGELARWVEEAGGKELAGELSGALQRGDVERAQELLSGLAERLRGEGSERARELLERLEGARERLLAVHRGRSVDFSAFKGSAPVVERAFDEKLIELARGASADWRSELEKFRETYDVRYVGRALACTAVSGELDKCASALKPLAERGGPGALALERAARELEAEIDAVAQRLSGVGDCLRDLRVGAPEPGRSIALSLERERGAARVREEARELLEEVEGARARIDGATERARKSGLRGHERSLAALRDAAKRLSEALRELAR